MPISGPVQAHSQESFCNKRNFTIYDNGNSIQTASTPSTVASK